MKSNDAKDLSKKVQSKLKEFGYDVKLTRCRELVAISSGLKNSHHLSKNNNKKTSKNTRPLYLTMSVAPNTINEYYADKIRGIKLFLNTKEVEEVLSYKEFIKKNKLSINKVLGKCSYFSNLKEEAFEDEDDLEINEIALFEQGIIHNDKKFYKDENVYYESDSDISYSLCIVEDGFCVEVSLVSEDYQVFYTSHIITWDNIIKSSNREQLKEKTIVYLQLEEDSVEKRENNKGYSFAINYLGSYTKQHIINGEDLETLAEHLWENDAYVDSLMGEIMDRSIYSSDPKDCYESALNICKDLNYYIVNLEELKHFKRS